MGHRVSVERQSDDDYGDRGNRVGTWEVIDKRWSEVEQLTGRELEQARQIIATASTQFKM